MTQIFTMSYKSLLALVCKLYDLFWILKVRALEQICVLDPVE